jgi:hypothetical protein
MKKRFELAGTSYINCVRGGCHFLLYFVFALTAVLLSACAALSPQQCATADWYALGTQDGSRGRPDGAADYLQACSKAGFGVDLPRYRSGRTDGLQNYCQLGNAIREGLAGNSYNGVCPLAVDGNFRQAHAVAKRETDAKRTLQRLQYEQNKWQAELQNSKTDDDRRRVLRELLQRSDRQLDDARTDLRSAQSQLERLIQDLRRNGVIIF